MSRSHKFNLALTIILLALAATGCTTISEKASKIQFHSQLSQALDGCKRIAPVQAVESRFKPQATESLSVKIREAASDVGADSVVTLNMEETMTEVRLQGIAYKCY